MLDISAYWCTKHNIFKQVEINGKIVHGSFSDAQVFKDLSQLNDQFIKRLYNYSPITDH